MFKVGDKVVFKNTWTANDQVLTVEGDGPSIEHLIVFKLEKHFRHATPEEIKLGHRIEQVSSHD